MFVCGWILTASSVVVCATASASSGPIGSLALRLAHAERFHSVFAGRRLPADKQRYSSRSNNDVLVALFPRGGFSSSTEEEDDGEETDDDGEDPTSAVVVEAEEDDEDEKEASDELEEDDGDSIGAIQIEMKVEQSFDEPWVPSPMSNLYASLGVMMLARRVDLFQPTVVRIARFAFIAYLIIQQLFLLYVRIQAKLNDDRTPVEVTNPLSSIIQNQLGNKGGGMVKNLASSFLASSTTHLEYDLKQANSMQSGLIFNMVFMWFLHFKMNQVQPLLIQTANGLLTMVYSPLFQIYVLGRNLERPFKNPAMQKMGESLDTQQNSGDAGETTSEEEDNDNDDDSNEAVRETSTTEDDEDENGSLKAEDDAPKEVVEEDDDDN